MPMEILSPVTFAFPLSILLVGCTQRGARDGEEGDEPWDLGELVACTTTPVQVGGDVFDANEVYLVGTLVEGSCGQDAVAHWSSPDAYAGQFDCYFDEFSTKIRPNDGRLLYTITFEDQLREFRCDNCPSGGGTFTDDPILPTPPCSESGAGISGFLVSPAGMTLHRCSGDPTWYDASGNVIYIAPAPDDDLIHLGHGDLALTPSSVIRLSTGESTPIAALEEQEILTARAREPESFLVVIRPPRSNGALQELWEVGANGKAAKRGVYPPLPAGARQVEEYISSIEPCGALLQFGYGLEVFEDIIVRRELGGVSAVVYDEANDPAVKIHISSLVTGP